MDVDSAQSNTDKVPVEENELNDDIDLSDLLPSSIDPSLLNSPVSLVGGDESYKNIINLCSDNAQVLKKTISDVLNSRDSVVITEVDDTKELEESLNKKIADFNDTVDGCMKSCSNSLNQNEEPSVNFEESCDSKEKSCSPSPPENSQESLEEVRNSDTSSESSSCNVSINSSTSSLNNIKKASKSKVKSETSGQASLEEKNGLSQTDENKQIKKGKSSLFKKKGEKTLDQIMKSLSSYPTVEEKLEQLCKRHLEALEEFRLVEPRIKQLEKQVFSQQREKENLQAEHNRMILAKSRLESLCREMQRQSKAVKEESLIRIKEEEEKRKEVANKFQSTLNDISSLMQENSKRNSALREENQELSQKLKMLVDNYSVWEENMKKIVQQKELEVQLANAKLAKLNLELKQETEKFLREKQSMLENMSELQKKCSALTENELRLRTELGDYTNKYEEFQSVLTNSSKVFANFKSDMDATSKKIKKLEKETNVYKQKWESSNKALLDMISHKEKQDKENANAQQRILTLEKLCRALQTERNELRNQFNSVTSSSQLATEPTVPSTSAECAEKGL